MWIRCHCAGWLCASRAATGWPRWRAITRGTFFNGTLLPRLFLRSAGSCPFPGHAQIRMMSVARPGHGGSAPVAGLDSWA